MKTTMAAYRDSDDESSLSDSAGSNSGVSTNVLLGYASSEPTEDAFSQLGGEPVSQYSLNLFHKPRSILVSRRAGSSLFTSFHVYAELQVWMDGGRPPSGRLTQCKACNNYMALLLQLNGDLPDRFPGHERRLYLWACRRKACRRKPGSIRATRAVRASHSVLHKDSVKAQSSKDQAAGSDQFQARATNMGASLFGGDASVSASLMPTRNPFVTTTPASSASTLASTQDSFSARSPSATAITSVAANGGKANSLPETFAQKARIAATSASAEPPAPWPDRSELPKAYPRYFLDAEYEFIPHEPSPPNNKDASARAQAFMDVEENSAEDGGASKEVLYESEHDKTFQHFADTLAHSSEQVLRYEFAGTPLLYSKTDPVGKALGGGGMPWCEYCGSARCFELQLTPHAILELEAEEDEPAAFLSDGMEWGTIILGACSKDCSGSGATAAQAGHVEYLEEWCGVQWEEVVSRSPASGGLPA